MKTFMTSGLMPLTLGCALLLMYHFDHSVITLFCAGIEFGTAICMLVDFFQLRHAKVSRRDKQIEVIVDAATFDRLQLMAEEYDLALSVFCSLCLEAVDPVELAAAGTDPEIFV